MTRSSFDLDDLTAPHVLREYALLADGERGVVVGPRGDLAWMCFPRWDSEAVFSSLVGGRGVYALTPRGRYVWGGYYEDDTLIWRNRWITTESVIECREALALPAHTDKATILRRLMALTGPCRVQVLLCPRTAFGDQPMDSVQRSASGVWMARTGGLRVRWCGSDETQVVPDGYGAQALSASVTLEEGEKCDFVLELSENVLSEPPPAPDELWSATERSWRSALSATPDTAIASRDVRRACAVLHGMTSRSGGMVAAATTSLPERAGEGRNYDYRYVWIRDQCFAGQALASAGPHPVLDESVRFVSARLLEDGSRLRPAYTTRGEAIPGERQLGLPGYPGGADVVGNRVTDQFQLDAFGESLLLLAAGSRLDRLDAEGWRAAEAAAAAIAQRWQEPDAGIWELEPAPWTQSRLSCVAGLRAICSAGAPDPLARRWSSLADAILADAVNKGVHSSGRWQRAPGDPGIDAALVLPAIRGAVPVADPKSVRTFEAVQDNLVEEDYVYRYRPDDRPLGEAEGAFVFCGFLMALACLRRGDNTGAARYFERNRAVCGPPGLFTEEFDVRQRQLRGNLPQAFVHALMVECAVVQSRAAGQGVG